MGSALCGEAMVPQDTYLRKPNRWCFKCRTRQTFESWALVPTHPSYYGPWPYWKCPACGGRDTDLFPGQVYERENP